MQSKPFGRFPPGKDDDINWILTFPWKEVQKHLPLIYEKYLINQQRFGGGLQTNSSTTHARIQRLVLLTSVAGITNQSKGVKTAFLLTNNILIS